MYLSYEKGKSKHQLIEMCFFEGHFDCLSHVNCIRHMVSQNFDCLSQVSYMRG